MTVGPGETLARRVRCGFVGATTVAGAVAAHGSAGGDLPSGSTLMLLVGVATVLGAVVTAVPVLRRGWSPLVPVLALGQGAAHLALGGAGHHAEGPAGPSPQMLLAHLAALAVCAVLIDAADRVGPRTEAALRAVLVALVVPAPVAGPVRVWLPVRDVHPVVTAACRAVDARRGPPVRA